MAIIVVAKSSKILEGVEEVVNGYLIITLTSLQRDPNYITGYLLYFYKKARCLSSTTKDQVRINLVHDLADY